jgi:hypothetical protein
MNSSHSFCSTHRKAAQTECNKQLDFKGGIYSPKAIGKGHQQYLCDQTFVEPAVDPAELLLEMTIQSESGTRPFDNSMTNMKILARYIAVNGMIQWSDNATCKLWRLDDWIGPISCLVCNGRGLCRRRSRRRGANERRTPFYYLQKSRPIVEGV